MLHANIERGGDSAVDIGTQSGRMTALGATCKSACVSVRARVFFVFMRVFLFEGRMMSRNDGANKLLFFLVFCFTAERERERARESSPPPPP